MICKRATQALQDAGIENIQIVKYLWGPAPEDTRAKKQSSRCFDTWQKARDAVLGGYRPIVEEWKPEFETEFHTPILESILEEFELTLGQDDVEGFSDWLSTLSVLPQDAKWLCEKLNEALPDDNQKFVLGPYGYIGLIYKK